MAALSAGIAAGLAIGTPAAARDWISLSNDYVAYSRIADPLRAGARGDRDALSRWPDNSPSALRERKATLERFQADLAALPPAADEEEATSRAVMQRQIDIALEGIELDDARMSIQFAQGFFTLPDTQAQMTTLSSEADARAWIARIAAIPTYFATETTNLQRGIDTGFTQPALVSQAAAQVVEQSASAPPSESPLLLPFATLPSTMDAGLREALRAEAERVITGEVRPAQRRLADFLKTRYLPASRPALGAGTLPGGEAYYAWTVRRETTTALSPAQIHAMGEAEIARIASEMREVMAQDGFSGTVRDYAEKLASDPANFPRDARDYAGHAGELAKRIDYLLPRYFGTLPRLTYGVRAKPKALETTSDGYLPGSPKTGQAGAVVYNASAARESALHSLPAWMMHEGVPGHHLQIALAQENLALPEYRRNDDVTAYVEGWALYAERLGEEMGIYRTPAERFGRLSMEMWRACRLVMDTGIHVLGWTRARAARCLQDNTAMSDDALLYEVDRYIGWPGQALGYKIGEIRIVGMRRKAEQALGDRFDLRAFHDLLLSGGALPIDVLEERVDGWIARTRAAG